MPFFVLQISSLVNNVFGRPTCIIYFLGTSLMLWKVESRISERTNMCIIFKIVNYIRIIWFPLNIIIHVLDVYACSIHVQFFEA